MPRIADLQTPSAQVSPPSNHQDNAPSAQQVTTHPSDRGVAARQESTPKIPAFIHLTTWLLAPFERFGTWLNHLLKKPQTPAQLPIEQPIRLSAKELKAGKGEWLNQLTQRLRDAVWCSNLMASDTRNALQSLELYETVRSLDLIYLNSENPAVKNQIEVLFAVKIGGRDIKFWGDRAGSPNTGPEPGVDEKLLPGDKLKAATQALEEWLSEVLRFTGRLNQALKK